VLELVGHHNQMMHIQDDLETSKQPKRGTENGDWFMVRKQGNRGLEENAWS
jgi:hypothetical protein